MAPISLISRTESETLRLLIKRGNWASENPGVILVFCIVFLVALGIIALFAYRRYLKRKANKESYETTE
ncbi:hypothetical protein N7523_004753 [Penicillium sp. IBT 18751x]|nr:hypothetical protein N7523_004753 [Penicillium sp. IBT 18751x]